MSTTEQETTNELDQTPEVSGLVVKVASLRGERKLTQAQLADLAGIRRDTISALERGRSQAIQFDTVIRLCHALDCQPGDLFALEDAEDEDGVAPTLGGAQEDQVLVRRLRKSGKRVNGPEFINTLLEKYAPAAPR